MNRIKLKAFAVFVIIMIPAMVWAQFTETKQISKRFAVTPETQIEIINKYGKIKINTWEKDSIIFDIKIKVEDNKLSRLEKLVSGVDFDFVNSGHFVTARTKIGENRSGLEKEVLSLKEAVLQSDGKIEIDYTVWMPETNQLKVENKFGDIYIADYLGDIEITLSNGNLKSHNFSGRANLKLSFADATINQLKTGIMDCNYSEVYIKKADKLKVTSKSSEFEINELTELNADSRRDKFRIQSIGTLAAKGSFTNYRISEISESLNIKTEYGDLDIEQVKPDFKSLIVESRSTDLNIYFSRNDEFGFEITHTKSENIFCHEINIKKEEVLDEKLKKIKLTGIFGNGEKTQKLIINAVGGSINIMNY